MQKIIYSFCLLFISSSSFCNEDELNWQHNLLYEQATSEQPDKKLNLGYCNPALDYCSFTFDFHSDHIESLVLIDKVDTHEFNFSDPKNSSCLSVDLDENTTKEEMIYHCEAALELLMILAH